ncbi:hypothetical protein R5R35_007346 [Gryllus longicercus]|uniref:thioredoxin-dependent peroxiredoxin n=1 Tax=Gryllus longicercus TaxID=2509291 RepID=A0AAN9V6Q9_9ORTH
MPAPALDKPAPIFFGTAVIKSQFKQISLSDFRGKYVVFFYYPSIFSCVCSAELLEFSNRIAEFENINCKLVGATFDNKYSVMACTNTPSKQGGLSKINISLISDIDGEITKACGLMQHNIKIPLRGLFINDNNQVLCQVTIGTHHVAESVDETLRFLRAFKYCKEHGPGTTV